MGRSTQGDDLAVLSAGGLLRGFFGALDRDVAEFVFGEQMGEFGKDCLPNMVGVSTIGNFQAHAQVRGRGLHGLELFDSWYLIQGGAEKEGWNSNLLAVVSRKGEHVSSAALHADGRQGVPA